MSEQEIFEDLLSIIKNSDDDQGVVSSCLVREGEIIEKTVSMSGGVHAEYTLLKNLEQKGVAINSGDVVYVTVEPCGKRTPGGRGEKMGDCTTNLIKAGVKNIIYAASDPDASNDTRHKFESAGVVIKQINDEKIIKKSINAFNTTCSDSKHWLPLG